jgi:hypothetical protein
MPSPRRTSRPTAVQNPLETYLRDINETPLLTADDELITAPLGQLSSASAHGASTHMAHAVVVVSYRAPPSCAVIVIRSVSRTALCTSAFGCRPVTACRSVHLFLCTHVRDVADAHSPEPGPAKYAASHFRASPSIMSLNGSPAPLAVNCRTPVRFVSGFRMDGHVARLASPADASASQDSVTRLAKSS